MEATSQHHIQKNKTADELKASMRKRILRMFLASINYIAVLATIVSLSMFVIGCVNVDKCKVNKNIPLFLMIAGVTGFFSKMTTLTRILWSKYPKVVYLESALYGAEFMIFLLGTYWVYSEYKPNFDSENGKPFCNKTAYMFAFFYISTYYVLLLVPIVLEIFICCCSPCVAVCSAVVVSSPNRSEV